MKNMKPKKLKTNKGLTLKVDYQTPLEEQLKELGVKSYLNLDYYKELYPRVDTLYDVEDGTKMLGKSPNECVKEFEKQGRRALNIFEGLALLRHNPEVLEHHIDLAGSRYVEFGGGVPYLCLLGGVRSLGDGWADGGDPCYGSASACVEGSSELGSLDSLNLESRVKSLEADMEKIRKFLVI